MHQLSLKEFSFWCSTHCPRLLDGLLHWITSSLLLINLEGEGQGAEPAKTAQPTVRLLHSHAGAPKSELTIGGILWPGERLTSLLFSFPAQTSSSSHYYHLPTPHLTEEQSSGEAGREIQMLVWSLSLSLPLIYLGHRDDEKMNTKVRIIYSK